MALVLAALVTMPPAAASRSDEAQGKRQPVPAPQRPLTPAVIDDTLEIGGAEIAGQKIRSRMTVAVRINGQGPFRFVVDSGADSSVIGESAATALRLPAGAPVMLHSITGSSQVDRVLVDSLSLGESEFMDLELPVLKDANLGGAGILGIDALVEQRLLLDFEKRLIKVEDAKRPAQRMDGDVVVTARRRRGQLILTQARADGRAVEAVIDTGAEITIGNLALRDRLLRRYGDRFAKVTVTGVTGQTMELQVARLAEIHLGSVVLRNVPIAFADVPPFRVFGMAEQPALLLGTDLMETFRRVSLDFKARKVRFQLRRCRTEGFTINTSFGGEQSRISMADGTTAACAR